MTGSRCEVRTETAQVERSGIPEMEYFCSNAEMKRLNPYWVQEQSRRLGKGCELRIKIEFQNPKNEIILRRGEKAYQ